MKSMKQIFCVVITLFVFSHVYAVPTASETKSNASSATTTSENSPKKQASAPQTKNETENPSMKTPLKNDESDNSQVFTHVQTQAIQKIIREYLIKNPTVIMDVIKELQAQQESEIEQHAIHAIKENAEDIFASAHSPSAGAMRGNVTLVEFSDYQCGHCKEMTGIVDDLMKKNPQLHVVFKEFPIFPGSDYIAKAAIAAQQQGKFIEFHEALMKAENPIKKDEVIRIAKSVGLNIPKLEAAMQNPSIEQEMKNNFKMAESLGLVGTPAFIVANYPQKGDELKVFYIPGTAPETTLQDFINKAKS